MSKIFFLAAIPAALALSGCANSGALGEKALGNLQYCDRHYIGNAGAMTANLAVDIQCHAKPFDAGAFIPSTSIGAELEVPAAK